VTLQYKHVWQNNVNSKSVCEYLKRWNIILIIKACHRYIIRSLQFFLQLLKRYFTESACDNSSHRPTFYCLHCLHHIVYIMTPHLNAPMGMIVVVDIVNISTAEVGLMCVILLFKCSDVQLCAVTAVPLYYLELKNRRNATAEQQHTITGIKVSFIGRGRNNILFLQVLSSKCLSYFRSGRCVFLCMFTLITLT